jgi:NitT/TauT family transport system ATP-binding protein
MLLDVVHITKQYDTAPVFRDISFSMEKGDCIAVCGPSGIGKTTLLKCIAGFVRPEAGQILYEGTRVEGPGPDRIMVFQEQNQLFPWKTAGGNIAFARRFSGRNRPGMKGDAPRSITPFLRMVGLEEDAEKYPYQLSGGMKQRAAVARSLAADPGLLLMDEPFGSVDWKTRKKLQNMLLSVWRETGVSIIFVTHDITEAVLLSDAILLFHEEGGMERVENTLPRPRNMETSDALRFTHRVFDLLEKL